MAACNPGVMPNPPLSANVLLAESQTHRANRLTKRKRRFKTKDKGRKYNLVIKEEDESHV
jgi:hypothetical protein